MHEDTRGEGSNCRFKDCMQLRLQENLGGGGAAACTQIKIPTGMSPLLLIQHICYTGNTESHHQINYMQSPYSTLRPCATAQFIPCQ